MSDIDILIYILWLVARIRTMIHFISPSLFFNINKKYFFFFFFPYQHAGEISRIQKSLFFLSISDLIPKKEYIPHKKIFFFFFFLDNKIKRPENAPWIYLVMIYPFLKRWNDKIKVFISACFSLLLHLSILFFFLYCVQNIVFSNMFLFSSLCLM